MKHFIFAVFIFLCSMSSLAFATDKSTDFNYKNFEKLPILHEGRIKPLESFARINLRQLSGKNTINHQNASSWLAETLFDPAQSVTYPVFILRNKNIKNLFELPDKRTTFTLQELQNGLETSYPSRSVLSHHLLFSRSPPAPSQLPLSVSSLPYPPPRLARQGR